MCVSVCVCVCVCVSALPLHLIKDVLAGVSPAVVPHQESDGGRVSAIGLEVVEALGEPVCV